ncbi:MAG: hypothetical protein WCT11_01045 [Candidatus Magasanikbacteria bacterium]
MDKKTKTIVVVVLAVVVVGGLYFGINRWRQQRLANQILKEVYGVNAGLFGQLTGGGVNSGMTNQIAQEMAKEAMKQQVNEAKEASKTPEDKYNDAEEMQTYDANSKAVAMVAKEIVEKAFGKAKLTSISTGMYGLTAGSGILEFKTARLTAGEDLSALSKVLADKGLPILQSGIDNKTAMVVAGSDSSVFTITFEIGGQAVGVSIMKYAQ